MRNVARVRVVAVAAALALLVVGCGKKDGEEGFRADRPGGDGGASSGPPDPGGPAQSVVPGAQEPPPTKPAGGLDGTGDYGGGVSAKLDKVESVRVEAKEPGEIAGDALAFRVTVTNGGSQPLDMSNVTASCGYGDQEASQMTTAPAQPFTGSLEPGKTSQGVLVFSVPKGSREQVRLSLSVTANHPVAVFSGKAPD